MTVKKNKKKKKAGNRGTKRMDTTATTGNVAGQAGEKEKMEKRKALGRGLAALFSGPRVVPANTLPVSPPFAKEAKGGPAVIGNAAAPAAAIGAKSGPALSVATPVATAVPASTAPIVQGAAAPQLEHSIAPATDHAQAVESMRAVVNESAAVSTAVPMKAPAAVEVEASSELASSYATGDVHYDAYQEMSPDEVIEIQAVADTRIPANLVVNVPIADVDKNPFQTRYVEDDEALEELAESIKANGVVQPIVVRPAEHEGRYILVLGERRLHASKKAGKTHVPALVRRLSAQQAAEMTIIENLQREDLSPLEQAEAFRVLSNEFKLTQEQIGQRVGLSRVSVANYMRLLKLPREVMQLLAEKRINFAQAKELLKLENNDRIAEAAIYAVKKGMNIEQIEMLVLRMEGLLDPLPDMPGAKKEPKQGGGARWVDPNVRAAQMDLERLLGVRVRIRDRKGHGKIVIEYSTVDDYERVVEMLRGRG
jgi:ParB family chromosome partitioning protein